MNTTENKPVIVGIGELLWDLLPDGKQVGGAPVNFVYHAAQCGGEGIAISAVGNDSLGKELESQLNLNGINHSLDYIDYPTGTVSVSLNEGIPSYSIIEDVAWDHISISPETLYHIKRADVICFGTLALRSDKSKNTILALLSEAKSDSLLLFDINIRQHYYSKSLIDLLMTKANILKINDEELVLLQDLFELPGNEDEACMQLIHDYQLKYLILTAGSRYSSIYTKDEKSVIDTPLIKVKDTVGAGDAFSGSFICSILMGKTLKEAHQNAVNIAAFVCSKEGAWPVYNTSFIC